MPFFFRRKLQTPKPTLPLQQALHTHTIQISDHNIPYTLRHSQRRSIGFTINHDGLRITAPTWASQADIERAIHAKQSWIIKTLATYQQRLQSQQQQQQEQTHLQKTQWQDGATLPYLGSNLTLRLQKIEQTSAVIHINHDPSSHTLTISLPVDADEQALKNHIQRWLQGQAQQLFTERVRLYGEKLGALPTAIMLSSAKTRWGSCTSTGKIRLNWRLIHFALPLIDYVIAHELAHLKEMNHSPRFWATVASIFPDFVHARKTLRQQAQSTSFPQF